jgi:DNA-binding transcriptional MerR regulator
VLKIGSFARLARVSVKMLRFYDEMRLFSPACVERRSGYRYYRAEQVPEIRRIRFLRHLGCTLAEIRELLALAVGSPEALRKLEAVRLRLSLNLARDAQRLRQLDSLLRPLSGEPSELAAVTERRLPLVTVLSVRERVRSLDGAAESMFESIERQAARLGCRAHDSPFLLFHDLDYRQSSLDIEACVPIRRCAASACGGHSIAGVDRAAVARFSGSYRRAPPVFASILEWMDESGAQIAGPVRECYLRFGADQRGYELPPEHIAHSAHEYETELQIPFVTMA